MYITCRVLCLIIAIKKTHCTSNSVNICTIIADYRTVTKRCASVSMITIDAENIDNYK